MSSSRIFIKAAKQLISALTNESRAVLHWQTLHKSLADLTSAAHLLGFPYPLAIELQHNQGPWVDYFDFTLPERPNVFTERGYLSIDLNGKLRIRWPTDIWTDFKSSFVNHPTELLDENRDDVIAALNQWIPEVPAAPAMIAPPDYQGISEELISLSEYLGYFIEKRSLYIAQKLDESLHRICVLMNHGQTEYFRCDVDVREGLASAWESVSALMRILAKDRVGEHVKSSWLSEIASQIACEGHHVRTTGNEVKIELHSTSHASDSPSTFEILDRDGTTDSTDEVFWSGTRLTICGNEVMNLPRRAKNLILILDAFQEDGWPERIDDPFPNDGHGQRRRDAISDLNAKQLPIQFSSDGGNEGICWRFR